MDELVIQCVDSEARIVFCDREPLNRSLPIERFTVRINTQNLIAFGSVYAGGHSCPTSLFAEMAHRWKGWEGNLDWSSLEDELQLRCSCDRRGHVIMAEAGQLTRLADEAAAFFGKP